MIFVPRKLARVKLDQHDNLPDSPGIYFACDYAFRVWYIGISTNSLRDRHISHERHLDFIDNRVEWLCYQSWGEPDDLIDWEKENIRKYNPILNKTHKPDELPIIDIGYDESKFIDRYLEIKTIQNELDNELEELKPNIVTVIEKNGGKLATETVKAHLCVRKIWKYSPRIEKLKLELEEAKREEENSGIASIESISVYPAIRASR